jgi:hypothetical protein
LGLNKSLEVIGIQVYQGQPGAKKSDEVLYAVAFKTSDEPARQISELFSAEELANVGIEVSKVFVTVERSLGAK